MAGATPPTSVRPLGDYFVAEPEATIVSGTAGMGGLRLVAGPALDASAMDASADALTVGVEEDALTFDFEPAAASSPGEPPGIRGGGCGLVGAGADPRWLAPLLALLAARAIFPGRFRRARRTTPMQKA